MRNKNYSDPLYNKSNVKLHGPYQANSKIAQQASNAVRESLKTRRSQVSDHMGEIRRKLSEGVSVEALKPELKDFISPGITVADYLSMLSNTGEIIIKDNHWYLSSSEKCQPRCEKCGLATETDKIYIGSIERKDVHLCYECQHILLTYMFSWDWSSDVIPAIETLEDFLKD